MGSIGELVSLMHKFTSKGQSMALKIMRRDKHLLDEPFAFMEVPERLAKNKELGALEREMVGNSYLSETLYTIWGKHISYIKQDQDFMKRLSEVVTQIAEVQRHNQVKLIKKNRAKIVKFAEQECRDSKLAQKIKLGDSEEELQILFYEMFRKHLLPQVDLKTLKQMMDSKNIEYFQEAYKQVLASGDLSLKLWKSVLTPSKNKKIQVISETLKNKYGIKYVYFESERDAEKMLRAVEFAREKNIPIPDNIIMTSAYPIDGGQNILTSNLERTVFINPQTKYEIGKQITGKNSGSYYDNLINKELIGLHSIRTSTPDELHIILHEFEHTRNFMLTNIKIPQKFIPTVGGLMNYARQNFNFLNDEVRNELLTKRDIMGLNNSEEALLSLWG